MNVAYQGEAGAFSEQAALSFFRNAALASSADAVTLVPCVSFEDVFEALSQNAVQCAVIPIENSLFGSVHINYDLLQRHDIQVIGEVKLRVVHNLMAQKGETLAQIKSVYSHWQALGQCQDFLKTHLPHTEVIPAYDTAGAAKMVATGAYPHAAAIASRSAAQHYGLDILAESIESDHQNFTRFLVLQNNNSNSPSIQLAPSSNDSAEIGYKTSLVYAMKQNIPGALFKSLAVFALRDIDLLKIESRPLVGSPWAYIFYLDIAGSIEQEMVLKALAHLDEIAAFIKVLGSYPIGETVSS